MQPVYAAATPMPATPIVPVAAHGGGAGAGGTGGGGGGGGSGGIGILASLPTGLNVHLPPPPNHVRAPLPHRVTFACSLCIGVAMFTNTYAVLGHEQRFVIQV